MRHIIHIHTYKYILVCISAVFKQLRKSAINERYETPCIHMQIRRRSLTIKKLTLIDVEMMDRACERRCLTFDLLFISAWVFARTRCREFFHRVLRDTVVNLRDHRRFCLSFSVYRYPRDVSRKLKRKWRVGTCSRTGTVLNDCEAPAFIRAEKSTFMIRRRG